MTTDPVPLPVSGPRVLGFGKDPATAAALQDTARSAGFRATIFALTDDAAGDTRLAHELGDGDYDVVAIGGGINGQNPAVPPDEQSTVWFERVLNIIHEASPNAKIALVRSPDEHVSAVERVLAAGGINGRR
jgi:hypothetical protein